MSDCSIETLHGQAKLSCGGLALGRRRFAAPVGVILHERARLIEDAVPDVKGAAKRRSIVGRAGGDVNVFKGRLRGHLAIGDGVHRASAREADVLRSRLVGQSPKQVHDDLFGDDLQAFGNIVVPLGRLTPRIARRAKLLRKAIAGEWLDGGRPVVPGHLDAPFVMFEVVQVELKAVSRRLDQLAEEVGKFRLAIRGKAHHLVLVAIVGKAQVHGDGGVEEPKRVRVVHPVENIPTCAAAVGCHRADEIAHAVDRENGGLLEGRDEKTSGDVRLVVLDAVKLGPQFRLLSADRVGKLLRQRKRFALTSQAVNDGPQAGAMPGDERQPATHVRARIERDCNMVEGRGVDAGGLQAPPNRLRGKAGPMFDAIEPFFLNRGNELAVNDEGGRGVAVVSVYAKDIHENIMLL